MIRRLLRWERGATLPDLLIGGMVAAIASTILFAGYVSATRVEVFTDHDAQAQSALRSATARLGRDVRQARKVYAESTARKLKVWVDTDRDNQQDAAEKITWELINTTGTKAKLVRRFDSGETETISEHFLFEDVFTYNVAPPDTTLVTAKFGADVDTDSHAGARRLRIDVRLRNATKN